MNDEREANREFVERWSKAGPLLDAVRKAELRALDEEPDYAALDALFEFGILASRDLPIRTTSGLVEQQRLFSLLRR
jgi:hypothetical protein